MASLLKRSIAKGLQVKTLTFLQTGETRNVSLGRNLVLAGIVAPAEQKGEGRSNSFVFGAPENFKQVILTSTAWLRPSEDQRVILALSLFLSPSLPPSLSPSLSLSLSLSLFLSPEEKNNSPRQAAECALLMSDNVLAGWFVLTEIPVPRLRLGHSVRTDRQLVHYPIRKYLVSVAVFLLSKNTRSSVPFRVSN